MSDTPRESPTLDRLSTAAVIVVAWGILVVVASLFPTTRLWGINYLAFLPTWVTWANAAFVACTIAHIYAAQSVERLLARVGLLVAILFSGRRGAVLLAVVVAAGGWILRSREALLGDGTLRAEGAAGGAILIPEMLPTAITASIVRYAPASWGIDGFDAYRLVSIAGAVLLALGLWWLVPKCTDRGGRGAIFWLLTFGTVRFLAGYIESYTLPFAAFCLWMLAVVAYRRGRLAAGWVIVFWTVTILSHITALALVPATLWVFATRTRSRPGIQRRAFVTYAVTALLVGVTMLVLFLHYEMAKLGIKQSHFALPLFSRAPHQYGIISIPHAIDFLNHWLLLAPAFLVAAVMWALRHREKREARDTATRRAALRRPESILWLLAAGIPLAAALVVEPQLGWARDWDLFALLSAPVLVGMALWLANRSALSRRVAGAVAVASAALWLVFSADSGAERRRYEALLDLDPTRAGYGHEIMAQYYRRQGDNESALRHYQKALLAGENLRYRASVAACYYYLNRFTDSEQWYRGVVARDSTMDSGWHGLSMALQQLGRLSESRAAAQRALALRPQEPEYLYQLGLVEMASGDLASASSHLESLVRYRPLHPLWLNALGLCYHGQWRLAEAETVFAEGLRLAPDNALLHLNAAFVALDRGRVDAARSLLSEYERLAPPDQRPPEASQLADSLARLGLPR